MSRRTISEFNFYTPKLQGIDEDLVSLASFTTGKSQATTAFSLPGLDKSQVLKLLKEGTSSDISDDSVSTLSSATVKSTGMKQLLKDISQFSIYEKARCIEKKLLDWKITSDIKSIKKSIRQRPDENDLRVFVYEYTEKVYPRFMEIRRRMDEWASIGNPRITSRSIIKTMKKYDNVFDCISYMKAKLTREYTSSCK